MNLTHSFNPAGRLLLTAVIGWLALGQVSKASSQSDALAALIVSRLPQTNGICVLPAEDNADLALSIARTSGMLILANNTDDAKVLQMRSSVRTVPGMLNERVYCNTGSLSSIPLANNYADCIVVSSLHDAMLASAAPSEILRVLSPNGVAILGQSPDAKSGSLTKTALTAWVEKAGMTGARVVENNTGLWVEYVKPMPAGVDDWTHWYHGPDNNPVSTDSTVKWPFLFQWLGRPYYGAQPRTTIIAYGRLFSATGGAAGTVEGSESFRNQHTLVAMSVYNGRLLWQRKLDPEYQVSRQCFVATKDDFFMIDGSDVLALDTATGNTKKKISFNGVTGTGKWLGHVNGVLFMMAGGPDIPDSEVKYQLAYNYPVSPTDSRLRKIWGFGREIAAYDLKSGATLWVHREEKDIDQRAIAISEKQNKLIFAGDGGVGCLNLTNGKLLWKNNSPEVIAGLTTTPAGEGNAAVSKTGFAFASNTLGQTRPALVCSDEYVVIAIQRTSGIFCFSIKDGALAWRKSNQSKSGGIPHYNFEDGKLYVKGTPIDLATGNEQKSFAINSSGCGPVTVCPSAYFSRHGICFDRTNNKPVQDHSFRSGCWQDSFPANGFVINTPYACSCSYSLKGFLIQGSAGNFKFDQPARTEDRLHVFSSQNPSSFPVDASDWPCYRANNKRSGSCPVAVPASTKQSWSHPDSSASLPTPPIAAGPYVFLGFDNGVIRALDAKTGGKVWEFACGGRIMAAPTLSGGRLYAASADGHLYALDATTGTVLWRFRAAPDRRHIMVYDSLSSQWPVGSGAIVDGDKVYCAAGIIDYEGTHVYALNAATGAIVWQNNTSGTIVSQQDRKGASVQGGLTIAHGMLWLASGNAVSPTGYSLQDGTVKPPAYASRSAYDWMRRGREIGVFGDRYILHGGQLLFSDYTEREKLKQGFQFAFASVKDDGSVVFPERVLFNGILLPAWDDQHLLVSMSAFAKLECWDTKKTLEYLQPQPPAPSGKEKKSFLDLGAVGERGKIIDVPMKLWTAKYDMYSVALSANAAIVVYGNGQSDGWKPPTATKWGVCALSRTDGSVLWNLPLPSEPLPNGVAITRQGTVVLTLMNGNTLCLAGG